MPALPPEEVRRLGDRRRRRQYAGAALASLVVVGAVGGGGLWLQGPPASQERSGPADTSRALAAEVRTDLPEDFPLSAGLEDVDGEAESRQLYDTTLTLCDELVGLAETDGVRADRSLAVEGGGDAAAYTRSVAVFDDVEQATAFVDDVEESVRGCDPAGEGTLELAAIDPASTGIADLDVPPAQALDLRSYEDPAASSYRVYRVANAVLVSTTDDPSGGPEALEALTLDGAQRDLPVLTAMQYYAGRDLPPYSGADPDPDPGAGSGAGEEPGRVVSPDQLLTTSVLPAASEGRGPWQAIDPTSEPTLACEAAGLGVLGADDAGYAEFTATIEPEPGTTPDPDAPVLRDAAINSAVLAFSSPEAADEAYGTVTSWLATCDAPVGGQDIAVEDRSPEVVLPDGAEGYWWATSYAAPEACGSAAADGCDAAWSDHQAVALVGSYLVLVSYREVGGPLEPEGMDARMDEILTAAASGAAYNVP